MDWIKKMMRAFALISLLVLVNACSVSYKFNGASINYDKVKTISIADFPIRSGTFVYAPLATNFNQALKDIYVLQTRLKLQKGKTDLQIEGEITDYNQYNQAVKADGYSSEVKLSITVNVRYVNNTNHQDDFEQKFTAYRTFDASKGLNAVQDELIEQMVKEIADQIFNATVANW